VHQELNKQRGIYVDVTFGGGDSREHLTFTTGETLLLLIQDEDAKRKKPKG
jgi:16S rRNA C1402 N4-methylase RsmH